MLSNMKNCFKLSVYDVVGLDFDNTLIQYNLANLFQLHYSYLTEYLVKHKGYKGLSTAINQDDVDFIRRGLFMDFRRGNVLNLAPDGLIISASHGTRKLSINDIAKIYGSEMRWSLIDAFIKDKLALWDGETAEQTRTFLDYTDTIGTLIFAKMVDLVDEKHAGEYSEVWPHLLEAIIDMYRSESDYTKAVLNKMCHYIHKCDSKIIEFLRKLRQQCKLLLITGSPASLVKPIASYALGPDWEGLFDIVVYSSKKPAFFISDDAFIDEYNNKINLNTTRGQYSRGNWSALYTVIQNELSKSPKCVYFGDNAIQDIYAPSVSTKPLDSVSIIDEALADGLYPGDHPYVTYLRSLFWGPYFFSDRQTPTIMGDLIMKYSKLCLPSLAFFADKPLDFEHKPFWATTK